MIKVDLVKAFAELDEPQLIGKFLGEVLTKDPSADPGGSIALACQKYGWPTFQEQLLTLMKLTKIRVMVGMCSSRASLHGEAPEKKTVERAL